MVCVSECVVGRAERGRRQQKAEALGSGVGGEFGSQWGLLHGAELEGALASVVPS